MFLPFEAEEIAGIPLSVKLPDNKQLEINWTPPTSPSYKNNVDATIFLAQRNVGVGVIVRDRVENFIAGLSKKIQAPLGTIEAEVKAFKAGIIFAKETGIRDFVLEGDSLVIVQALKEWSHAPSSVSPLIYEMLVECHEFRNVVFSHVRRQGNKSAYLLAKQAFGLADFST
ncbi:uncharacterized protein LOC142616538 [Castanea sativa]|uniref:uncharacterized protein LOC142616538 n=1 Tax=Castanea sativa TaxID=21020 RepID=UPI003F64F8A5